MCLADSSQCQDQLLGSHTIGDRLLGSTLHQVSNELIDISFFDPDSVRVQKLTITQRDFQIPIAALNNQTPIRQKWSKTSSS